MKEHSPASLPKPLTMAPNLHILGDVAVHCQGEGLARDSQDERVPLVVREGDIGEGDTGLPAASMLWTPEEEVEFVGGVAQPHQHTGALLCHQREDILVSLREGMDSNLRATSCKAGLCPLHAQTAALTLAGTLRTLSVTMMENSSGKWSQWMKSREAGKTRARGCEAVSWKPRTPCTLNTLMPWASRPAGTTSERMSRGCRSVSRGSGAHHDNCGHLMLSHCGVGAPPSSEGLCRLAYSGQPAHLQCWPECSMAAGGAGSPWWPATPRLGSAASP